MVPGPVWKARSGKLGALKRQFAEFLPFPRDRIDSQIQRVNGKTLARNAHQYGQPLPPGQADFRNGRGGAAGVIRMLGEIE